jgi:outer membrane receptor protein involved in Fe transport
VNQAPESWQPGYSLTNLAIGIGDSGRRWEASLIGRNIFDQFYSTSRATYSATAASTLQRGAGRYSGLVFRSKI